VLDAQLVHDTGDRVVILVMVVHETLPDRSGNTNASKVSMDRSPRR
jgi:hypothetical protein